MGHNCLKLVELVEYGDPQNQIYHCLISVYVWIVEIIEPKKLSLVRISLQKKKSIQFLLIFFSSSQAPLKERIYGGE